MRPEPFDQCLARMRLVEMVGQVGEQDTGLLLLEVGDDPLSLMHAQPAQHLDPAPNVHKKGSLAFQS
ncbi:MAG TPA: hypothetical protein VKU00_28620 [Chthonomonadaceae bacterium]|nr:hypothetical protein [Chthonomonadaceae bacterium]